MNDPQNTQQDWDCHTPTAEELEDIWRDEDEPTTTYDPADLWPDGDPR